MSSNLTDRFIDELYDLRNEDFSDSVVLQAKRCLLDYLGATFAGAEMLKGKSDKLLNYLGETQGNATVIGFNRKASIENAVFVNGINSHVAELDDGVRFGMIHPGSPVLSALLPIAEKENVKGSDLLLGIITGYEAAVRIACAIQPSHYSCGYHPTSTCGTIGAAIGIAAMLGFTKSQMKDALSSAAISAAGSLKVLEDGSEIKPFNVGRAAIVGLLAAVMARAGFKGPDDPLGGETGFFSMMTEKFDLSHMERESGKAFAVEKVYVKPYAACRHAHPAIEAVLKIRLNSGVCADDIKDIKVTTYHAVLGKHDYTEICGVSSAKMSIPYSVAVALMSGKAGIEEFTTEWINNPEIAVLTKKVVVCADDEITALVPQKRAAIVDITTFEGVCHTERVDYPKGEPENPLSNAELEQKFINLAKYGNKPREEIHKIIETVWQIETELPHLFELL